MAVFPVDRLCSLKKIQSISFPIYFTGNLVQNKVERLFGRSEKFEINTKLTVPITPKVIFNTRYE